MPEASIARDCPLDVGQQNMATYQDITVSGAAATNFDASVAFLEASA